MNDKLIAEAHGLLGVMLGDIEDLGYAKCHKPSCDTIKELIDALEAAEKQIPRWISCEERLPEVGKCVLVRQTYKPFRGEHGEFEEITVGYLHQPTDNRRKPYFYWVAVSDYGDMVRAESICPGSKYITHWMPLPKGEEDKE